MTYEVRAVNGSFLFREGVGSHFDIAVERFTRLVMSLSYSEIEIVDSDGTVWASFKDPKCQ